MKKCILCKDDCPKTEFYKNRSRTDGLSQRCKSCEKVYRKERYHHYRATDLEGHRTKRRNEERKRLYGITPAQYAAMLHEQCGVCVICKGTNDNKRELVVDHCHNSGAIRGLLCSNCNVALGYAEDSPDRLRDMADYIEARTD